jgi:hypothetical protein
MHLIVILLKKLESSQTSNQFKTNYVVKINTNVFVIYKYLTLQTLREFADYPFSLCFAIWLE